MVLRIRCIWKLNIDGTFPTDLHLNIQIWVFAIYRLAFECTDMGLCYKHVVFYRF